MHGLMIPNSFHVRERERRVNRQDSSGISSGRGRQAVMIMIAPSKRQSILNNNPHL